MHYLTSVIMTSICILLCFPQEGFCEPISILIDEIILMQKDCRLARESISLLNLPKDAEKDAVTTIELYESSLPLQPKELVYQNYRTCKRVWPWEWNWFGPNKQVSTFEKFEQEEKYTTLAKQLVNLHDIDVKDLVTQQVHYSMDTTAWIKGLTLIVGGALLIRYPPPIRTLGVRMVKLGLVYIGWESYDSIMDYLVENKILNEKLELGE